MRDLRLYLSYAWPFAVLAGCASAKTNAPQTEPSASGESSLSHQWTGDFRPQMQRSGGAGPVRKNNVFGRVTIVPLPSDSLRARVQLDLSTTLQSGASSEWSVYPGRCGSGSGLVSPLVPPSSVPRLDVSQNGKAHIDTELGLSIPRSGTYHLNVFWGTASPDLSRVMACANLIAIGK